MRNYCFAGLTFVGLVGLASVVLWSASPATSEAHCQVPCGIYDDAARIARLREDTATIAKATKAAEVSTPTSSPTCCLRGVAPSGSPF